MIDVHEAYEVLFANIRPVAAVECPLDEALYRTLAAPVRCDVDHPPFDRAVMDGYAVRATDVAQVPVKLRITGDIPAGVVSETILRPGEAMRINTGAPVPPEADAVVQVESTELTASGEEVLIHEAVPVGQFIVPRATYASAGRTALEAGTRLTPLEVGVAATAGASRLTVYRRPTVATLSTGDELIDIRQKPTGAQIRNSNEHLLCALITAAHAEPVALEVARDDRDALRERIVEGLRFDILCISGGVSMGAFDYVPEVLERCGATFHIRKMAIKPGRPMIFATMPDGTVIFALPGNPASVFVCFELMVKPALAALEGRGGTPPPMMRATLSRPVEPTGDRRAYVPARARVREDSQWEVEPLSWHGSGDSIGLAGANALIMRPPDAEAATTGGTVSIILLDRV